MNVCDDPAGSICERFWPTGLTKLRRCTRCGHSRDCHALDSHTAASEIETVIERADNQR